MLLLDTLRSAAGRSPTRRAHEADRPEERLTRHGIEAVQAFAIARPADEIYRFWRDLANLPRFMTHLERVEILSDRRSRWVARAPKVAGGGQLTWESEITGDEPGRRIAWRSLPGSDIDSEGEVTFAPALGDRGTEVRVRMRYVPPAGRLGHAVATAFGAAPRRQMRDDLRNCKRLLETGEIPTTAGQPVGACLGRHGKRARG